MKYHLDYDDWESNPNKVNLNCSTCFDILQSILTAKAKAMFILANNFEVVISANHGGTIYVTGSNKETHLRVYVTDSAGKNGRVAVAHNLEPVKN